MSYQTQTCIVPRSQTSQIESEHKHDKKKSNSKTLSLRGGGGGGSVRMNLSHGRSKSVLIETKRKKIILPNKNNLSQIKKETDSEKLERNNKNNKN